MKYGGKINTASRERRAATTRTAVLLGVVFTAVGFVQPADALTLDAGVCTLEIDLTSTSDVPPLPPSDATWMVNGRGTCTTSVDVDIMASVDGELTAIADVTAGCAVGAFDGDLTLDLAHLDYDEDITLDVTVVVAGAAVALVGREGTRVVATGTFVQDTTNTTACLVDPGTNHVTWCGVLVFADPEL